MADNNPKNLKFLSLGELSAATLSDTEGFLR